MSQNVKATARNVRISPRKVSVVASLVRGRNASEAVTILSHTPRRAATPVKKVIESAMANAENNHGFKIDSLVIEHISVTPGVRLKRYRPAAHGRALPFERKSSHIFVVLNGERRVAKPVKKSSELKKKQGSK